MTAQSTTTLISSYTATGTIASYSFTSIPQTYTDLYLVGQAKGDTSFYNNMNYLAFQFNGDTSTHYSRIWFLGRNTGSGYSALSEDGGNSISLQLGGITTTNSNANNFTSFYSHFMNYTNTTTYKAALGRTSPISNLSAGDISFTTVGSWQTTAAVNTITILPLSGNFVSGSTFSLYGVAAA